MNKGENFLSNLVPENYELPELEELKSKFTPYLKEIRKRVIFIIISFVIFTIAGFIFYEDIIKFLVGGFSLQGMNVVFTSPFQYVRLAISCGITTGVVITVPIIILQILSFLKPALKNSEFKTVVRFIPFCLFLFISGFIFGIYMMRWQMGAFVEKSASLGIGTILDVVNLLSTVLLTSALLGVGFQLPIIFLLLMRIGVLERKKVAKQRSWVYLGAFVFTLFLPAESVLVDIVLTLPLIALFEFSLLMDFAFEKKKKRREAQEVNKS